MRAQRFIFIYRHVDAPVLQWGDSNMFKNESCAVKAHILHCCSPNPSKRLLLLTWWLISELTGSWTSCLKVCDSLAKGIWVEGWGLREFQGQAVSEAQWVWPSDESLWSVRRGTGRFYKSSSDTDSSRRFTVSNNTREKMRWEAHTAAMLVLPADCILLVRVWYFISISSSQTCNMHVTRRSRHNNKDAMTRRIAELKRGVSQAADFHTAMHWFVYGTNTGALVQRQTWCCHQNTVMIYEQCSWCKHSTEKTLCELMETGSTRLTPVSLLLNSDFVPPVLQHSGLKWPCSPTPVTNPDNNIQRISFLPYFQQRLATQIFLTYCICLWDSCFHGHPEEAQSFHSFEKINHF